MSFLERVTGGVRSFLTLDYEPPQTRAISSFTDYPGLTAQISRALGYGTRPWTTPSIDEALGVPAILRAVNLIAKTGGSLSLNAERRGVRLEPEDRPRIIVRPNPLSTPHAFFYQSFYDMVTRGELWWWVAARDTDDSALSLYPVPPQEVTVEEDPRDLRYPIVKWREQVMPRDDMVHVMLHHDSGDLRGYGPLQKCGAAVSVAVEAQEWAANFYHTGHPSIWIRAAGQLGGGDDGQDDDGLSEAQRLKQQWMDALPNMPRVTDEGIEDIKQFDPNPQGAQMLDARDHQNGDAARMFGIPASLLDYKAAGSNLTYQNLEQEMTKFLRTCLIPYYLDPVEQAMSDLLTRSTVCHFNVDAVNRADVKTRFEVYEIGIRSGVLAAEQAQVAEGILPGSVETAPVPLAPPQAVPPSLPVERRPTGIGDSHFPAVGNPISDPTGAVPTKTPANQVQLRTAGEVRCDGMRTRRRSTGSYVTRCDRLLATEGTFVGQCPRCKKQYVAA